MKIIFFGTPHFVVPILESLLEHHDVIAIVTAPDRKVGRKQVLTPTPVKAAYQGFFSKTSSEKHYPLNIFTPEKLTNDITKELSLLQPDLIVTAAYGKIIPQEILDLPVFEAINVHPSLLPKYRGPSPIQQTLLQGDKVAGVTLIRMDEQMDHGPILATETYEVHSTDTFDTLANHLFGKAAQMILQVIKDIESGTIKPITQDETKVSFTKIIKKEDGYFDSNNPPTKEQLDRMIRAYFPWPTAWTKIKIHDTEKIMKLLPENKVQLEGKNPMSIKDFINGYPALKEQLDKLL